MKNKPILCGFCRKPFVPFRSNQIYCSLKCRLNANGIKTSIKLVEKKPIIKTCEICGKNYTARVEKQRFCSPECYEEAKRAGVYYKRQDPHKVVCEYCGTEFETTHASKKYCCTDCYESAAKERRERNSNAREKIEKTYTV